ncbi:site-2 protease family protein [bacterium]|nr:site-2 protease family protein [bacterium]
MGTQRSPHGLARIFRRRGIPLFSVLGIRIVADYSWFLIVALITGSLSVGWFPSVLPDRSPLQYISLGIITAFFFFASVLIHELSHSIVAVRHGIPVRKITLFLFGGIAEISREPGDPTTELKVALAGPIVSAVLAAGFWGAVILSGMRSERPAAELSFLYLAVANTFLLMFNLLPGLPLDGGRVLRAIVWRVTGDLRRATYIASATGQAIAGLMVISGLLLVLFARQIVTGLWLIFIALFLRQAAEASYRQVVMKRALRGANVGDAMTQNVIAVPPTITVAELVDGHFLHHHFICYPVVEGGQPLGFVSIKDVKHVPRDRWADTHVGDIMTPLTEHNTLDPRDGIAQAMRKLAASGSGRLPVLDGERLVGIVTRGDIMRNLEIRSDLSK